MLEVALDHQPRSEKRYLWAFKRVECSVERDFETDKASFETQVFECGPNFKCILTAADLQPAAWKHYGDRQGRQPPDSCETTS